MYVCTYVRMYIFYVQKHGCTFVICEVSLSVTCSSFCSYACTAWNCRVSVPLFSESSFSNTVCMHVCMYAFMYSFVSVMLFSPKVVCMHVCMCVCVYIYIYIYIYTCLNMKNIYCAHKVAHIRKQPHSSIHTYMHTYVGAYMPPILASLLLLLMRTYIHTYMHACIHTADFGVSLAYFDAYIHTYIHACMHTYRQFWRLSCLLLQAIVLLVVQFRSVCVYVCTYVCGQREIIFFITLKNKVCHL